MMTRVRALLLLCAALQLSSAFVVTMRPRGVALRLRDSHAVRMMDQPTEPAEPAAAVDAAVEDPTATGEAQHPSRSARCA